MELNSSKFQLLRIGWNWEIMEDMLLFSNEMKYVITHQEGVKDLEMWVDNRASFLAHGRAVLAKVNNKVGWVLWMFGTREPWFMEAFGIVLIGHIRTTAVNCGIMQEWPDRLGSRKPP